MAQLSLVEHALCPLDDRSSLVRPLVFETGYFRTDEHKHARFVPVRVTAHEGLSATDELYLWGLLALAFAQPGDRRHQLSRRAGDSPGGGEPQS